MHPGVGRTAVGAEKTAQDHPTWSGSIANSAIRANRPQPQSLPKIPADRQTALRRSSSDHFWGLFWLFGGAKKGSPTPKKSILPKLCVLIFGIRIPAVKISVGSGSRGSLRSLPIATDGQATIVWPCASQRGALCWVQNQPTPVQTSPCCRTLRCIDEFGLPQDVRRPRR